MYSGAATGAVYGYARLAYKHACRSHHARRFNANTEYMCVRVSTIYMRLKFRQF